jgi:hypothetical protein
MATVAFHVQPVLDHKGCALLHRSENNLEFSS